jgi:hypothetical protein
VREKYCWLVADKPSEQVRRRILARRWMICEIPIELRTIADAESSTIIVESPALRYIKSLRAAADISWGPGRFAICRPMRSSLLGFFLARALCSWQWHVCRRSHVI